MNPMTNLEWNFSPLIHKTHKVSKPNKDRFISCVSLYLMKKGDTQYTYMLQQFLQEDNLLGV